MHQLQKNYDEEFDEHLAKRLESTHRLCDGDTQKILFEGVYTYQYLDSCQRLNEALFQDKKEFYRNLTVEDITDADFKHTQKYSRVLEYKI